MSGLKKFFAVSVFVISTIAAGCGDVTKESPDPVGALNVSIANLSAVPGVETILLTATGPGPTGSGGFTHVLTANGSQEWTYLRSNLEPGAYEVQAVARDAGGATLYETGLVPALVPPGGSVGVTLVLHPSAPVDGVTNHAPRFHSVVADSATVQPGQDLELTFQVADLEGDAMSLLGEATCAVAPCADVGNLAANPLAFTDPTPNVTQTGSMTWTAPGTSGLYSLRFVLTDAREAATEFTMQIAVGDATGNLVVDFRINMAPVVSEIAVTPSGSDTVDLAATVSDDFTAPADMVFAWAADPATCTGSFDAQAATTTFTLTGFATGSDICELTLTVTDANLGVSISRVFLNRDLVDLRYQPALRAIFQSQTHAIAGDVLEFGVEAELFGTDAGTTPTFTWTLAGASQVVSVDDGLGGSELEWTAVAGELPCDADGNVTVSVTARGASSGLDSHPVEFVVAAAPELCL